MKLAFDDSLSVYISPSPLDGKSGDALISARRPSAVDKCGECSKSQLVTWKRDRHGSSALGKFRIKPGPLLVPVVSVQRNNHRQYAIWA